MSDRCNLRKEAYQYILLKLSNLPASAGGKNWLQSISLEEILLLKEGIADPSESLVALVKDLVGDTVSDLEIQAHLITPFQETYEK
jgi:hypothetical protein